MCVIFVLLSFGNDELVQDVLCLQVEVLFSVVVVHQVVLTSISQHMKMITWSVLVRVGKMKWDYLPCFESHVSYQCSDGVADEVWVVERVLFALLHEGDQCHRCLRCDLNIQRKILVYKEV